MCVYIYIYIYIYIPNLCDIVCLMSTAISVPVELGIPPLKVQNPLESSPPKSRFLVLRIDRATPVLLGIGVRVQGSAIHAHCASHPLPSEAHK